MTKAPYDQPTSTGRLRRRSSMIAATSSAQSRSVGVVRRVDRRFGHTVSAEVVGNEPKLVVSALSYCFAQQRWFCDHPWTNRIGGPSALPHSRTSAVRPPPPRTGECRPPAVLFACQQLSYLPPRSSNRTGSSPPRGEAASGRGLIFPRALRICEASKRAGCAWRDTGWWNSRERGIRGTSTRARRLEQALGIGHGGSRRDDPPRGRGGHRQDAARLRARETCR